MIYSGFRVSDLSDLQQVVNDTVEGLKPYVRHFDAIVATGMSGVLVAAPAALALGKPLVVIRKEGDGSHDISAGRELIGKLNPGDKVAWVDDFVSMGDTRYRVFKAVELRHAQIRYEYMYHGESNEHLTYAAPKLTKRGPDGRPTAVIA